MSTAEPQAAQAPRRGRRRRQQTLERVLGTPALFATAYGNVGSSIYYALGLVAGIALGILFNPLTGPETRRFIKDAVLGGHEPGGTVPPAVDEAPAE